jgi:hypothetical protein
MTVQEHITYAETALTRAEEEFLKATVEGEEVGHLEAAMLLVNFASVHASLAQVKQNLE